MNKYLSSLEQLLWPDLFIIGGGVSKKAEKFLPLLDLNTPVVPAQLQNDAGIVGAALAAGGEYREKATSGGTSRKTSARAKPVKGSRRRAAISA